MFLVFLIVTKYQQRIPSQVALRTSSSYSTIFQRTFGEFNCKQIYVFIFTEYTHVVQIIRFTVGTFE